MPFRHRPALATALAIFLVLPGAISQARAAAPTAEPRLVNGHRVAISGAPADLRVSVDGRPMFADHEHASIDLVGSYPTPSGVYALLRLAEGGAACPSQFRVIDLSNGAPRSSPAFGTCRDGARASAGRTGLVVTMPRADGKGDEAWTFAPQGIAHQQGRSSQMTHW